MDDSAFVEGELYKTLTTNNVTLFEKLVQDVRQKPLFQGISASGETYLHLAIQKNCDQSIIKGLISRVRLGQRNKDGKTALELALEKQNAESAAIAQLHQERILECIKDGKVKKLKELVIDGWSYWPVKGMPEFETFAEAPMYFSQGVMDVTLNNMVYIFTKKQLKECVEAACEKETGHLAKHRDALGMSLLHKAVLFRDVVSVTQLLKHSNVETLLGLQDNMGRTPLHYSSCFNDHNEIRIRMQDVVESMSLENHKVIADKTGYTAMDYLEKKAKIDTKKVLNLVVAVGKVEGLEKLFAASAIDTYSFDKEEAELSLLIKNCDGKALLDVTGRNILHKVVIFGNNDEVVMIAKELVLVDKDNVLYKGQDLWGRTPLHYAYMLNHTRAIQVLNTKRGTLTIDTINEVKQIKDHEGKTINDYHLEEEDAATLTENLQASMRLLYKIRPAVMIQQKLLKSVLSKTPDLGDSHEDDSDVESDIYDMDDFGEFNYEKEMESLNLFLGDEDEEELIFSMKDFTGSTLAHYAVRLNHEKLQDVMTNASSPEKWVPKIRDNLGRTPSHFLSCLPKESEFKEWMMSVCEAEFPNSDRSTDLSDTADDEGDSSEDEEDELEHKRKVKRKEVTKPTAGLANMMDETPQHNAPKSDHMNKEELLHFLRTGLESLKLGIQVKDPQVPTDTASVKRKVNQSEMDNNKPFASVRPARLSSTRSDQPPSGRPDVVESATPFDSEYLKKELGVTLTGALCDISARHPADPIEYLAHYLYKHAENVSRKEQEEREVKQLKLEQEAAENEKMRKEMMRQEKRELKKVQMEKDRMKAEKSDVIKEEEEGEVY